MPGSSPESPHVLDRGDIAIGGGGPRGGGTSSPSPVSHAPDTLLLASPIPPGLQPAGYPCTSAGSPHPARAFGAPPPPRRGAGSVRGDTWWAAVPGSFPAYPHALDRGGYVRPPLGVRLTGRGDASPLPCLQIPILRFAGSSYSASSGIPIHFPGSPPPPRAFAGGYPCTSASSPHPTRAFARRYPYTSAGSLHPARAFAGGYPYTSAGTPHPARACDAPPPPRRGGGSAWRYQGSSRIRGATGGPPCPALLQDLPMLWTVGISPLGEAARGAGELVPPPLSLTLQAPCFSLPAFLRGLPIRSLPAPPARKDRGQAPVPP